MKPPEYQQALSLQSPILLDEQYKKAKIEKMLAILGDACCIGSSSKRGTAIDVGCSGGLFASALSPFFFKVYGIDIDSHAIHLAKDKHAGKNVQYLLADSLQLPLPDQSVDLVICNHVYEHVPNAELLFEEIFRVLHPGGYCYFGAASRLTVVEPHYHLPFLSWLPKRIAHIYMRLTGKGDYYYENLRTYWGIKQLINKFICTDYTLKVVMNPHRFRMEDLIPSGGIKSRIPSLIWRALYRVFPGYIFILRKPGI